MDDERYYRRKPKKILDATTGWDWQLKGIYSILIDIIMLRDNDLPDDSGYIAGIIGCTKNRWTKAKKQLVELGKISIVDGNLVQTQAKLEQNFRKSKAKTLGNNGAKPKKNKDLGKSNDLHKDKDKDRDIGEIDKSIPPTDQGGVVDFEEDFWNHYPVRTGQPFKACELLFLELPTDEQKRVCDSVSGYKAELTKTGMSAAWPYNYLKGEIYKTIDAKPVKPKQVVGKRGPNPEAWAAWNAHFHATGQAFKATQETLTVPSLLPPKKEEAA